MPWRGPEYPGEFPTLGWLLLDWWADYLPSPRDESAPLIFTDEQALILLEWFAIDPVTGQFVYRRGCSRRSKGWGKSPVEAAKCVAELVGPVRFDGWDANGEPVGRPWGFGGDPEPWVQVAAVSEDQTDNTYSVINYFLSANDGRAADELRVDHGITRCYLRDRGGRLEPVTARYGSREGQPVTYGQLDETHLWTTSTGGVKLARTVRRNAAKMGGRSYETTNAFIPGAGSVAESTHKAAMRGHEGIFYDAVEAPPVRQEDSDETLKSALAVAYGDAHWVDLDRLVRDIRDPDAPWPDSLRFFFNHNVAGHGVAVDPYRWQELKVEREIEDGIYIGLGFDGSISDDCTVLRGCTADGHSFILGKWIRPLGPEGKGWRVPRLLVDQAVRDAFGRYKVGRMLCDPAKWWTEIEGWAAEFGEEVVLFFDTNSDRRMAPAVDRFLTAITEGTHTHDGDPTTDQHIANAHKRKAKATAPDDDNRTLYTLTKGDEGGKIDAAIADVLAYEAAMTMPEEPEEDVLLW
jgi:hypothetical protein